MRTVFVFLAMLAFVVCQSAVATRADAQAKSDVAGQRSVSSGSDSGGSTPAVRIEFAQKVVFALALGTDPPTNAKITVALASELRRSANRTVSKSASAPAGAFSLNPDSNTAVVPEGGWGLSDYIDQCQKYPDTTQGAFIVLPPSTGADSENYLILLRQNATIAFNAMIADCESDGAKPPKGTPKILWTSDTATGRYGRSTVQALPLAVLTSVYLAFAPQRTYQTTTTKAYPTPNPLPPDGARTSVQTLNSSVINASGTGSLQTNVVTTVAGAQLAIGRLGNTEHLTMHAAEDAVGKLLQMVSDECGRVARHQATITGPATAAPVLLSPAPFCAW